MQYSLLGNSKFWRKFEESRLQHLSSIDCDQCKLLRISIDTIMSSNRFISASAEDIKNLRDGIHEEGTKRSTAWGVKLFRGKQFANNIFGYL